MKPSRCILNMVQGSTLLDGRWINGKAQQVSQSRTPWSYRDAAAARLSSGGSGTRESRRHHRLGKGLLERIAPPFGGAEHISKFIRSRRRSCGQATVSTNGWSRSRTNTIQRTCFASTRTSNHRVTDRRCEEQSGVLGRGGSESFKRFGPIARFHRPRASKPIRSRNLGVRVSAGWPRPTRHYGGGRAGFACPWHIEQISMYQGSSLWKFARRTTCPILFTQPPDLPKTVRPAWRDGTSAYQDPVARAQLLRGYPPLNPGPSVVCELT